MLLGGMAKMTTGNRPATAQQQRRALELTLKRNPDDSEACLELAELLFRQTGGAKGDGLERARELAERAILGGPVKFEAYLLMGKILVGLERFKDAIKALNVAENFDRDHPDLYVALSVAYAKTRRLKQAQAISRQLLGKYPVGSRRSANPEAEVLVLETLNNTAFVTPLYGTSAYAQTNTIAALPPARVSLHHFYIDAIGEDGDDGWEHIPADTFQVIYNNAANAELNHMRGYGAKVRAIAARLGLEVVNGVDATDLTTRENNFERLQGIDNLIFPKTVRFEFARGEQDAIAGRIEADFEFPVLIRSAGTHRASALGRADNAEELRKALPRFARWPCFVIQFHESRHPSGNFLMYRAAFIGGAFYPARMYLDGQWLVSGPAQRALSQTPIEADPALQDEEKAWLADPEARIGGANMAALLAVNRVIGLDCYGIDFGIGADGRIIIFEANSAKNLLSIRRHGLKFPYLKPAALRIQSALEDIIIAKARG